MGRDITRAKVSKNRADIHPMSKKYTVNISYISNGHVHEVNGLVVEIVAMSDEHAASMIARRVENQTNARNVVATVVSVE